MCPELERSSTLSEPTYSLVKASNLPTELDNAIACMDTEGTGLDIINDEALMLVLALPNRTPYVALWDDRVVEWVNDTLPKLKASVWHNAKYDWHMLRNSGVSADVLYKSSLWCTLVGESLCDEHRHSYSMDSICSDHFGMTKDDSLYQILADRFGGPATRKAQMSNIGKVDYRNDYTTADAVFRYAARDASLLGPLFHRQKQIHEEEDLNRVMLLEMLVLKTLVEMEYRGAPVDPDEARVVLRKLEEKQEKIQTKIKKIAGFQVNPRSPNQMEEVFNSLGLTVRRTAKGNPSFDKNVLANTPHEFAKSILESRDIKTIIDSFINSSILGHVSIDGRIHANFNQVWNGYYGTGTGRLSCNDPNLQQIPKRKRELASLVRSLFVAPSGYDWIAGDWEQFEYRVFGSYANALAMVQAYAEDKGADFHQIVADMANVDRSKAKTINLGMVFGMGEGKLAQELGLPYEEEVNRGKVYVKAGPEAKALFSRYHTKFPEARKFATRASAMVKKRSSYGKGTGWVKTIFGRRIRFPRGRGGHKACGLIYQGTSADLMKKKLVELNDEFRNTDVQLILAVHDEFDLLSPKDLTEETVGKVKEIMEDVPELKLPILADVKAGSNWWEASS